MERAKASIHYRTGWLAALCLGAAVSSWGCQKPAEARVTDAAVKEAPPVKVETQTIAEKAMPVYATFSGSLVADRESVVAAGAAGKVLQTFVERGDFVQQGTMLARLDSRATSAMVNEANAQLESARAAQALAKAECERNRHMFEKGAITQSEFDRVNATCTTSQWSAEAAEARKTSASISLNDAVIRAPFAGFISDRFVNAGEYVGPASRIALIVSVDPLRAQLTVPESFAGAVSVGQNVEIHVANDASAAPLSTALRYVSPDIRQASRDLIVEALIPNKDHKLRSGTFIVGRVSLGEKTLPVVPRTALRDDGTSHHLFAVTGGQLEERIVQLGETAGDLVAITDGVKQGDKIVASVSADLRDGLKVQ
jgi:membrane fusion protein (multidrug efflux system)